MAELLAAMPDGSELAEWRAYLEGDAQVQALVASGTDAQLAERLIWDPRDESEA